MKTAFGHLTYCTNIHPGENWPDHFSEFSQHFQYIKQHVSPDQPMGIGLRLSNEASLGLTDNDSLERFKEWLQANEAYVFTMNGFPYGGFHKTVVKDQVHAPDWTTRERLSYTLRLFKILEAILPDNMDGGISTSPLSYRRWFDSGEKLSSARQASTGNLVTVIEALIMVHRSSGKLLHLDIEPEPDGLLESGEEFMQWFEEDMLRAGRERITKKFGVSVGEAENLIKEHLRLCYDVCHFAIGFERHIDIIRTLGEKGIRIGKIQISAALKAVMDDNHASRATTIRAFAGFNESTYLHQVIASKKDGQFIRYPDLPQALMDHDNPFATEWRAHFHVPVSMKGFETLQSTQDEIIEVLDIHKASPLTQHLEVETYTWDVLPALLQHPLRESIIGELEWAKEALH